MASVVRSLPAQLRFLTVGFAEQALRSSHDCPRSQFLLVTRTAHDLISRIACSMICHTPFRGLAFLSFLLYAGVLAPCRHSDVIAQEKGSKAKQPTVSRGFPRAPQPLILRLEAMAQKYKEPFESELALLDRELREVLREMNRKGMDAVELFVAPSGAESRLSLALTARNFVPVSAGPWDKQDVLSFQALGDGPVYLNLSLLQRMLKPLASYRSKVLTRLNEPSLSIESWNVTWEKSSGQSVRFEGRFEAGEAVIHPVIFLKNKKAASELEIKADGQEITQALARGTFPLAPLKILGGQFSTSKSVLEFFGKQ